MSAERDPRVPGFRRGLLEYDDFSSACLIENVSTRGFRLECLDEFVVGQRMRLTSRFGPGETIRCELEVRHVAGSSIGATIVGIDSDSERLCRELVEQHYALLLRRRRLA
jgi:PilZ domain-containing protein